MCSGLKTKFGQLDEGLGGVNPCPTPLVLSMLWPGGWRFLCMLLLLFRKGEDSTIWPFLHRSDTWRLRSVGFVCEGICCNYVVRDGLCRERQWWWAGFLSCKTHRALLCWSVDHFRVVQISAVCVWTTGIISTTISAMIWQFRPVIWLW